MLASADASALEANGITRPGSDAVSRIVLRLPASAITMDTSDGIRISLCFSSAHRYRGTQVVFPGIGTNRAMRVPPGASRIRGAGMPSSPARAAVHVTAAHAMDLVPVIRRTKAREACASLRSPIQLARMRRLAMALVASLTTTGACGRSGPVTTPRDLGTAAESYVRLVLALGERDADSLDSYHGPASWAAEARTRHATLDEVQRDARAFAGSLRSSRFDNGDGEIRRAFLIRQLDAVVARIDILRGARPPFADEARRLFGLDIESPSAAADLAATEVRAAVDRELPGRGTTAERFAAFDRRFLIPADRLDAVMTGAIEACRSATRLHVMLPPAEGVGVSYVRDLPWSAFTRYEGNLRSAIRINAALPLTVDRALDLACHEAYPGHHTIGVLLDQRRPGRVELLVQPAFSPQSLLHEAASSVASAVAFSARERVEL